MHRIQKDEGSRMKLNKEFLLKQISLNENRLAVTAAVAGLAGGAMAMPPKEDMPMIDRVLQGLGHAEHRGNVKGTIFDYDPKFYIRTGKPDPILNKGNTQAQVKHSSAYGPFQFTGSTIKDLSSRHKKLFAGTEDYTTQFIEQGREMVRNPNDPVLGYGKSGRLGTEEHHEKYIDMSRAALAGMAKDIGVDFQNMTPEDEARLVKRFRGLTPEKAYSKAYEAGKNVPRTTTTEKPGTTQQSGTTSQSSGTTSNSVTTQEKPVTTQENGDYTIGEGDTIYSIARKLGKKPADIIAANPQIKDPNQIKPNQKLRIPK